MARERPETGAGSALEAGVQRPVNQRREEEQLKRKWGRQGDSFPPYATGSVSRAPRPWRRGVSAGGGRESFAVPRFVLLWAPLARRGWTGRGPGVVG